MYIIIFFRKKIWRLRINVVSLHRFSIRSKSVADQDLCNIKRQCSQGCIVHYTTYRTP